MLFSPTLSSAQVSYVAKACGPVSIEWQVGGADAGWYDSFDDLPTYTNTLPCKQINIDATLNVLPGIPSNGRAEIDSPAAVTVYPSAPGSFISIPAHLSSS
jgi:hypothetical protein